MPKTETFRTLEEVRAHKQHLISERDRVQEDLRSQLDLVRDPEFRRSIMGDAFGDLLQSWRPLKSLSRMMGSPAGAASSALGLILGAKAKTPLASATLAFASFVLPELLDRLSTDPNALGTKLKQELNVSLQRVKNYVSERRQAHQVIRSEE